MALDPTTQTELRNKLEEELVFLEGELKNIGRRNPANPADWEATPPLMDIQHADKNEEADKKEGYFENAAILAELETRYNNIKSALKKMDEGTYGTCEIGNQPIEIKRLEANPAARTCMKHMDGKE